MATTGDGNGSGASREADGEAIEVRDLRQPGYFRMDNEIIEVFGPRLGPYGIATYAALCCVTGSKPTQDCYPSLTGLGKRLGCSRTKVVEALQCLAGEGLILIEHRDAAEENVVAPPERDAHGRLVKGQRRLGRNLYTLQPVPKVQRATKESPQGDQPKVQRATKAWSPRGLQQNEVQEQNQVEEQNREGGGGNGSRIPDGQRANAPPPTDKSPVGTNPNGNGKANGTTSNAERVAAAVVQQSGWPATSRKVARVLVGLPPDPIPEIIADRERMVPKKPDGRYFDRPYSVDQMIEWSGIAHANARDELEADGLAVIVDGESATLRMTRAGAFELGKAWRGFEPATRKEAAAIAGKVTPAWRGRLFLRLADARRKADPADRAPLAETPKSAPVYRF